MFDAAVDSAVVVSSAHVNNFICIITGPPNGPVLFCCLASVVVCNTAGGRAGGRHSTAGQSCYVPLGRHLGVLYVASPSLMSLLCIAVNAYSHSWGHCIALVSYLSRVSYETHVTVHHEYSYYLSCHCLCSPLLSTMAFAALSLPCFQSRSQLGHR